MRHNLLGFNVIFTVLIPLVEFMQIVTGPRKKKKNI